MMTTATRLPRRWSQLLHSQPNAPWWCLRGGSEVEMVRVAVVVMAVGLKVVTRCRGSVVVKWLRWRWWLAWMWWQRLRDGGGGRVRRGDHVGYGDKMGDDAGGEQIKVVL
ncbi:hypothetical protein Tco_0002811 [Tanacetum coccineum]